MRFKATDNLSILEKHLKSVGDITDELVKSSYHKYIAPLYRKTIETNKKRRKWVNQQQYRHTQRDLLKLKYKLNGYSARGIREGFVYAIWNPQYPEYIKFGSAIDAVDRLNQYQTYSPHRDYELVQYAFVPDRIKYEKQVLEKYCSKSEWACMSKEQAKQIIKELSKRFTPT